MKNLNRPITTKEIEADIKSLPTKKQTNKKPRTRRFQHRILPELQGRANTYTPQSVPHNRNRRNIAKLFI